MPRLAEPAFASSKSSPRIALMHDRLDWHSRELIAAFAARNVALVPARLAACGYDTGRPSGLVIDGFAALPDAVLVRLITGGSFEAVTVRLGVLHALRALGVLVINDARAIENCADKSATSFLLAQAGVATPEAWTVQSLAAAKAVVRREAGQGPLVLKPLFGSQGRGLKLIRREADLPDPDTVRGVYYLQRFVGVDNDGYRDTRVLVSNGAVIAAMTRHARHWITNIKQGAIPSLEVPDEATAALALRAAKTVRATIAGVDIVQSCEGTRMVLEVNSMPGWSGLQKVTPVSIAQRLADDFLGSLALAGGTANLQVRPSSFQNA